MKKSLWAAVLCAALLCGCSEPAAPILEAEETLPAPTVPADGDPNTIACQGSYSGSCDMDMVVARVEDAALTNRELQVWYRAEVEQYRQSGSEPSPDFSLALDVQPCDLDEEAFTWQQYFLKRALSRWHTVQSLICHSEDNPLPLEEAYKGDRELLDKYMTGMPATRLLYGYDTGYRPNSMHQTYLEGLSEEWKGEELDMAYDLNYAYAYFTTLSDQLESQLPDVAESGEKTVTIRHILLRSGENVTASQCLSQAQELLTGWMKDRKAGEATFAQLASQNSQDAGSAPQGGLYRDIRRDQLPEELAAWCFGEERQEGETTVIIMNHGVHILYFVGSEVAPEMHHEAAVREQKNLLEEICRSYPMEVDYTGIGLTEEEAQNSVGDLLYPDIAHERFPEVPLYLQQNYSGTMYGEHKITTNGCGITSLAMLGSYMADDELTPPEMCALYGSYSRPTGTAGSLFEEVPPQLGFYLIKKTYDWREAKEYMEEGHPVVVCQYRGYWTSGGHYLVLEKITEDGMVQVRDSNLYNYRKLVRHKEDKFPWETIQGAGQGYWIYEKKAVDCAACIRCGAPETLEVTVVKDYLCEKCQRAQVRRESYLAAVF